MKTGISVSSLLSYIPDAELEEIGESHKVDYQVKRLYGKVMFKLLLYGLLSQKALSTRILETLYENIRFQTFSKLSNTKRTDHSSIADRLCTINFTYFEAIYKYMTAEMSKVFSTKELGCHKIVRFDSTIVGLSSKLLKIAGIRNGKKSKKKETEQLNLKFTIGFDGIIAKDAVFYNQQSYVSDHIALGEVLVNTVLSEDDIAVFDQGMRSRKTFGTLGEQGKIFVTRTRAEQPRCTKYKKVRDIAIFKETEQPKTEFLTITHDEEVKLYDENSRQTKFTLRLIKAIRKDNNKPIWFLTNSFDLSTLDICEIYRKRWDIELFFRYIKHEFGFTHLLSRTENGIKVMLLMTLIASMLIYIYRKGNNIESFRIAKLKFINELDIDILKIIIELCQGKPDLLDIMQQFKI
jgi:hypothetical protein